MIVIRRGAPASSVITSRSTLATTTNIASAPIAIESASASPSMIHTVLLLALSMTDVWKDSFGFTIRAHKMNTRKYLV